MNYSLKGRRNSVKHQGSVEMGNVLGMLRVLGGRDYSITTWGHVYVTLRLLF